MFLRSKEGRGLLIKTKRNANCKSSCQIFLLKRQYTSKRLKVRGNEIVHSCGNYMYINFREWDTLIELKLTTFHKSLRLSQCSKLKEKCISGL